MALISGKPMHLLAWGVLGATLLSLGCGSELDTTYGRRRGRGSQSVAGTAVLSKMIQRQGGRVSTWSRISPKLDTFDVIFWFPDDFEAPSLEHRAALERWVWGDSGRTLVYVGRDYDAHAAYWRHTLADVPDSQWEEAKHRVAVAAAEYEARRLEETPPATYARWFTLKAKPRQRVSALRSSQGWDKGVDESNLDLTIGSRLDPPVQADLPKKPKPGTGGTPAEEMFDERDWETRREDEAADRVIPASEVLLDSNAGPIVRRVAEPGWGGSQILVVANGGFLLNLPLVNSEHRILAQRLIDESRVDGREVVFLESGTGGPPIYNQEPEDSAPTGLELFTVWPIGVVMLHLLGLGVLACFVLYPTFGRPHELAPEGSSDFGKHVEAVGALLAQTQGQSYVSQQLRNYHLHVKRESGVSHLEHEEIDAEVKRDQPGPAKIANVAKPSDQQQSKSHPK